MRVLIHGGNGHMGRILAQMALDGVSGAELVATVDPTYAADDPAAHAYQSLTTCQEPVDCVIDFSHHSATAALLDFCTSRNIPVVVCTTGQTAEEKAMIEASSASIPVFFAANMSLGIAVLQDLVRRATAMFPDANIEIVEKHHNRKLDVPSGTALMLANSIKEVRSSAVFNIGRHENGKRTSEEIGIHSLRLGNEVGTHEVIITTGNETITLKHEAESRALFAEGALKAASFLYQQTPGLYNMHNIVG